ncbi:NCS2 family permease [Viridibacillus sp. FSL R5-0477]|uniref:Xanthine/uracil/vitamin C permease n=1 Tax=Viridibacillus arenosi FSL R5-213 TaxID=1227360 RepID=W4ENH4_9BACL|nr:MULTISPECIES: NCS2 family permease [Viridibacillus]ETT82110.1 xanthine/uracil/vitamin C permease [Viridibacillus arenosi FSL R5-213]OMC81321.1 NCS2 family permease [Viridibacillus sp. FSL H8-0123]OMC86744.1 NCS2 family permease [Viridibacillus sp. FSL H7-0596]OMC90365.1 NCS2 family permease [Viridibacillus arenosi]
MFRLKENGTNVKTELIAGITTFFTMIYIVVVNPSMLSASGVPLDQVFIATIIAIVIGTLWMSLFANYPLVIGPSIGLNAYFTYSIVVSSEGNIDYLTGFAAVFVSGIIFVLLSLTPLREKLILAIPENLKRAIAAGIGLFIAFLGLRMGNIIVDSESNLVMLGDLTSPGVLLTLFGLFVTVILMVRNVSGALFIGMFITGIVATLTNQLHIEKVVAVPHLPEGILVWNPIEAIGQVISYGLYGVVFSFILVTLFDTTGTMIGVAKQAGLMKDGKLPRARKALLADSVATTFGAMFGTSPTTAFIESSAGVAAGGRTGLTSLTVAILFVAASFFGPLVSAISGVSAITSPILIIVGTLMIGSIKEIEWEKFEEAFPAFLIILIMPLTSSIATGIAFGFISYPILKIAKGEAKKVHPLLYVFAILFAFQLTFLS